MKYKTPGVYVREISLVPPSMAEVATAIPAFVGCTQKTIRDGENFAGKQTRITSLLGYQQYFGGDCTPKIEGMVDTSNNNAVGVEVKRFYVSCDAAAISAARIALPYNHSPALQLRKKVRIISFVQ